jgi:hypothetical protein
MGDWMLLAVAIALVAAVVGYCRLLALRGRARAAWQPVEVGLAGRHEWVRQRLSAIRQAGGYDSEPALSLHAALQTALDARGVMSRIDAENELSWLLRAACCPQHEDTAAGEPPLLARWAELRAREAETIESVRCYNQHVMTWNRALHQYPWTLLARVCRFRPLEYFVLDDPSLPEPGLQAGWSERRLSSAHPEHSDP